VLAEVLVETAPDKHESMVDRWHLVMVEMGKTKELAP
jgi:hypothetical protein